MDGADLPPLRAALLAWGLAGQVADSIFCVII
jgi:hypothetical protein